VISDRSRHGYKSVAIDPNLAYDFNCLDQCLTTTEDMASGR